MTLRIIITFTLSLCCATYSIATNEPVVIFKTDSLILKSDTISFFKLIDKNYANSRTNDLHRELIKSEVRYRLHFSKNNEAEMDEMTLNCYTDRERRAYTASCLNYNEPLVLMQLGQAKVYLKSSSQEIIYEVKQKGSKFRGHIERLYIDKTTNIVFFSELVSDYKWWNPKHGRTCTLPTF